jgi:hypothetical protein
MSWQQYAKFYFSFCNNNDDYKHFITGSPHTFSFSDVNDWAEIQNNKCIKFSDNIDELTLSYKNNQLITTRFGCVESSFIIKYLFGINCSSHLDTYSAEDVDKFMKSNAGLYYQNPENAKDIHNWWVDCAIEILKKSVMTSCLCFLKFDLALWSHVDMKGVFYNWGNLTKLLLQNSGGKKILYVGSARKSIEKAYSRGVQSAWKFNVPNFTLYVQDTPQTTLGCSYPHLSIKETCEKIVCNIKQNYSDFDTAIFGCGAYGPPLMSELSNAYKQKNLIYLGSACYTMFGIYSDGINIPDSDVVAENWIKPEEKIQDQLRHIDDGKYWNKD